MNYRNPATKVITDLVTFTNARIWEPQIILEDKPPLYTASVIIPKSLIRTNDALNLAVEVAIRNGATLYGAWQAKAAKKNLPIIDGDNEDVEEIFRGNWVVNAASLTAPKIYDNSVYPITDSSLFQPGCKARVVLEFFSYPKGESFSAGVGCMLGNIQKAFTRNDYERLSDTDFDLCTEHFTRIYLKEAD